MDEVTENNDEVKENLYHASFFPGEKKVLPSNLSSLLIDLQNELDQPVCLLLQGKKPQELSTLSNHAWDLFISNEHQLPVGKPISLVIDSPGGYAKPAYQIARLLKQRCGKFNAVIPCYAKSAATLLVMGATEIYMGNHAELGPLDAQTYDAEREHMVSALDTVQSLERVRTFALESIDASMFLLIARTRKKTQSVLPHTLRFVAELMKPLLQQLDIIEYTQMSRTLKVAEEYAKRLLIDVVGPEKAQQISSHYVEFYKEHDFFISSEEAQMIGLPIQNNNNKLDNILHKLYHEIRYNDITAYGLLKECEAK